MKAAVIAVLVAVIAIGGAFSAFAGTRTIETEVELELQFWVSLSSSTAFVSTRQEDGGEWITHDFRVPLTPFPEVETLLFSEPVSISVPVAFDLDVEDPPPLTPLPAAAPHLPPGEEPSGRGRCCRVRGMSDNRAAQRAVVSEMRKVIAFAQTNFGFTHEGSITINISYTPGGCWSGTRMRSGKRSRSCRTSARSSGGRTSSSRPSAGGTPTRSPGSGSPTR